MIQKFNNYFHIYDQFRLIFCKILLQKDIIFCIYSENNIYINCYFIIVNEFSKQGSL